AGVRADRAVIEDGDALAAKGVATILVLVGELAIGKAVGAVRAVAERLVLRAAAAAERDAAHSGACGAKGAHEVRHGRSLHGIQQVVRPVRYAGDARFVSHG